MWLPVPPNTLKFSYTCRLLHLTPHFFFKHQHLLHRLTVVFIFSLNCPLLFLFFFTMQHHQPRDAGSLPHVLSPLSPPHTCTSHNHRQPSSPLSIPFLSHCLSHLSPWSSPSLRTKRDIGSGKDKPLCPSIPLIFLFPPLVANIYSLG